MPHFYIPDIHCDACIRAMTQAVRAVDPHAALQANLTSKMVGVETTAGTDAVAEALRDAGFTVEAVPVG